jgi:hypothetical protein
MVSAISLSFPQKSQTLQVTNHVQEKEKPSSYITQLQES